MESNSSNKIMDSAIIKSLYAQWLAIKGEVQATFERGSRHGIAERYRDCHLFKGTEGIAELAELYKSPQGTEFCIRHHFPSLAVLRLFKAEHTERYGIYIDAGNITLDNPAGKVMLVGMTVATVNCTELRNYRIACLHGAKAIVNASGWAVARVEAEKGCQAIRNKSGNAIVL